MANNHFRTKRPRIQSFESPDLTGPNTYRVQHRRPSRFTEVSTRVQNALISAGAVKFLRSKIRLDDQDDDDWKVWRHLGSGGFGTVAVWVKNDDHGELLDEMVMKEQKNTNPDFLFDPTRSGLAREAVLQKALNEEQSENIVHLRGFKAYERRTKHRWRYYLEYAPHGNLEILRARYRAFKRYLPELFIWHVFASLAQAILVMETFVGETIGGTERHRPDLILHLDLKPENIFLGYEEHHQKSSAKTGGMDEPIFPSVKLGDFGLSEYVRMVDNTQRDAGQDAAHNPRGLTQQGTEGYHAPEQRVYGYLWPNPPGEQINPAHKFNGKLNVWNVGKVIFDLCSLAGGMDYDSMKAKTAEVCQQNGGDTLENWDKIPFAQDRLFRQSPYSAMLTHLVSWCMQAKPEKRPTAQRLHKLVSDHLLWRLDDERSNVPWSVRNQKLYYRGNDINNMTRHEKNCDLPYTAHDHFYLTGTARNDPDEPPLRLHPMKIMRSVQNLRHAGVWPYNEAINAHDELHNRRMTTEAERDRFLASDAVRVEDGKVAFLREYEHWPKVPHHGPGAGYGGNDSNDDGDNDPGQGPAAGLAEENHAPSNNLDDGSPPVDVDRPQYLLYVAAEPILPTSAFNHFHRCCYDQLYNTGYPLAHMEARIDDIWTAQPPTIRKGWEDDFAAKQHDHPYRELVWEAFSLFHADQRSIYEDEDEDENLSPEDILRRTHALWNATSNKERMDYVAYIRRNRHEAELENAAKKLLEPDVRKSLKAPPGNFSADRIVETTIDLRWNNLSEGGRHRLRQDVQRHQANQEPVGTNDNTEQSSQATHQRRQRLQQQNRLRMSQPKTPYDLYCNDNFAEIQAQGLSAQGIEDRLGHDWNRLPFSRKRSYIQRFNNIRARRENPVPAPPERDMDAQRRMTIRYLGDNELSF